MFSRFILFCRTLFAADKDTHNDLPDDRGTVANSTKHKKSKKHKKHKSKKKKKRKEGKESSTESDKETQDRW